MPMPLCLAWTDHLYIAGLSSSSSSFVQVTADASAPERLVREGYLEACRAVVFQPDGLHICQVWVMHMVCFASLTP